MEKKKRLARRPHHVVLQERKDMYVDMRINGMTAADVAEKYGKKNVQEVYTSINVLKRQHPDEVEDIETLYNVGAEDLIETHFKKVNNINLMSNDLLERKLISLRMQADNEGIEKVDFEEIIRLGELVRKKHSQYVDTNTVKKTHIELEGNEAAKNLDEFLSRALSKSGTIEGEDNE